MSWDEEWAEALSQESYDYPERKCSRCWRINTHRIYNDILWCGDGPAVEGTWQDIVLYRDGQAFTQEELDKEKNSWINIYKSR